MIPDYGKPFFLKNYMITETFNCAFISRNVPLIFTIFQQKMVQKKMVMKMERNMKPKE